MTGVRWLQLTTWLAVVLAWSGSGCSSDQCWDRPPSSGVLGVGQTVRVEVEIVNGGYNTPDVAGAYWSNYEPLPVGMDERSTVTGTATLLEGDFDGSGELRSGVLRIDFDDFGPVDFDGPLVCE